LSIDQLVPVPSGVAMIRSEPDRLDERIRALSRSRAVLALLISKVDEELIPLKSKRNAHSPPCRLPDELLVRIFELAQIDECANDGWLSVETSLPEKGWWDVMTVCSRFRTVAVEAPQLWARFDPQWSIRWRDICLTRAQSWPLRFRRCVQDGSDASDARQLLEKGGHATIIFTELPGAPTWDDDKLEVLNTCSSLLRSLHIKYQTLSGWYASLPLAPPLLANFTNLSHLEVAVPSEIDDAFAFPPTLEWLYMRSFKISSHTDRLRRLFLGIPRLHHLEAVLGTSTTEHQSRADSGIPMTAMSHLQTLILMQCNTTVTHAIVHSIATPRHVLEIDLQCEVEEEGAVQKSMLADIWSYAHRFWTEVTGSARLPSVALKHWHSNTPDPWVWLVMSKSGDGMHPFDPSVLVEFGRYPLTSDDFLLPLVSKLEIIVLGTHHDLHYHNLHFQDERWPNLSRLLSLQTLSICVDLAWELIHDVQAWIGRQLQHPILVEFSPESTSWQYDHNDLPTLRWSQLSWQKFRNFH
jgi:hypothetical protein